MARIRGVQLLRDTHLKRVERFEGLVPVVEDWHTRMTFMIVSMQTAGHVSSLCNIGTLQVVHKTGS